MQPLIFLQNLSAFVIFQAWSGRFQHSMNQVQSEISTDLTDQEITRHWR